MCALFDLKKSMTMASSDAYIYRKKYLERKREREKEREKNWEVLGNVNEC